MNKELRTKLIEFNHGEEMCISGRAVIFGEKTLLFTSDSGVKYYEEIDARAFDGVDLSNIYFYYNHIPQAHASTKNKSLEIDVRDDGLYFTAHLQDTTIGRDLYSSIKSGLVDKCSFGFRIGKEQYDEKTNTFTIEKIDKLYEISAVDLPAYENTYITSRTEIDNISNERLNQINKTRKTILKTLC
ncbi:MAG: HK97 family phage prohead protease [Oscillospiraceae bacterium]|nr:HK97 family phage prohead protease [Oscillospiraceae bacterium]